MNKKYIFYALIFLFVAAISFILIRAKNQQDTSYQLLERKGVQAKTDEYKKIRATAATLKTIIQENPNDNKSRLDLATIYIKEARITGNNM